MWYAAIFGTVLAVSRSLITEEHKVFCPEAAMADVVKHTHYFPRHWRNRCHLKAVQTEFEELFQVRRVQASSPLPPFFPRPTCATRGEKRGALPTGCGVVGLTLCRRCFVSLAKASPAIPAMAI